MAMVLHGDITFDSRVQREANSLVGAGIPSPSSVLQGRTRRRGCSTPGSIWR